MTEFSFFLIEKDIRTCLVQKVISNRLFLKYYCGGPGAQYLRKNEFFGFFLKIRLLSSLKYNLDMKYVK